MNIENLHGIRVRYLPATNFRGSRFKMISLRFGDSITMSYDYSRNSVMDMATDWLQLHNQDILGQCEDSLGGAGYIMLKAQDNGFTPLKEMKS